MRLKGEEAASRVVQFPRKHASVSVKVQLYAHRRNNREDIALARFLASGFHWRWLLAAFPDDLDFALFVGMS